MKCQSTYDNMLLCNKPDEITRFSYAVVRIFCPVVYYLVLGACGIQESDVKINGTAENCAALASAGFEKTKASPLRYRISPYCRSWQLNPRSARKVKAFCKQALNASSPLVWHSTVLKYLWSTDINNIGLAQPITSPICWRTGIS